MPEPKVPNSHAPWISNGAPFHHIVNNMLSGGIKIDSKTAPPNRKKPTRQIKKEFDTFDTVQGNIPVCMCYIRRDTMLKETVNMCYKYSNSNKYRH